MANALALVENPLPPSDRRAHSRLPLKSLSYVVLDEGNGGIILNISEGGLAVQAVTSLMDEQLPAVRFQLSQAHEWLETKARITWTGRSRKVAGLRFVDLPEQARGQIRELLSREAPPAGFPVEIATPSEASEPQPGERARLVASTLPLPADAAPLSPKVPASKPTRVAAAAPSLLAPLADSAREPRTNRGLVIAVAVPLAFGSLVAGWAAGQGAFDRIFERVREVARPGLGTAVVPDTPPQQSGSAALVSEIGIVDANNVRWAIPFDGALGASVESSRAPSSPRAVPQARKSRIAFQTWVLSPPQHVRATSDLSESNRLSAPDIAAEAPAGQLFDSHSAMPPPPPAQQEQPRIEVLKQGELINRVSPIYPALAQQQRIEGTVKLHVTVGDDGAVRSVALISGPQLLTEAAKSAVRQWRFSPTLLDGKPVESERDVSLVFRLSRSSD
ncbi:MAG TPA: TonB family protein [Candidatus Acidoferrales bacterium]|nr:TonB family protein [Candidatus Acidoferrales bacterium]